jgi:hypothetical protein
MKSKTDREEPSRAIPYTDIEDPMRINVLRDKEEAKCTKSNTDKEEPRRDMPYTDKLEPKRAKVLNDNEAPR